MSDNYNADIIKLNNIIKSIEVTNINLLENIYDLLDSDFNINTQNENGDTILHILIKNYKTEIISDLIDYYDFDLNLKNRKNESVIDYAYEDIHMNFNLIIKLLNKGCKINPSISFWTKEFMFYVKDLILLGYKQDFYDSNNNSILHYIISSNRINNKQKFNFFKELVEKKQDYYLLNNENESPVDLARKYNYKDIIDFVQEYEYNKIKNNILIDINLIKYLVTFLI